MTPSAQLRLAFALVLSCSLLPAARTGAQTPLSSSTTAALVKNLPWRSIGPAVMGGRIDEFAVVESRPGTIYVGTASGGVFKSLNYGNTWESVFDHAGTTTIGSVAVAPSNPDIVWVGTGEANNRQSSSWGDGVYKSTDAGKTWTHMGLRDTSSIGEVVIDPRAPDTVYVAAVGNLWAPNHERGLFKTNDGGKTWRNVLFVNDDTGVTDLKMDPSNPDTLYAAAYQRRRQPFGFNGGGPGSAIYKSTDAGVHWTKLTKGLPEGDKGRIGLAIYRKDPKILYAVIEDTPGSIYSTTGTGGVFRSSDSGETWTKQSNLDPRPMYYSHVFIDPNNERNVWVLGVNLHYSDDAGKTWVARPVQKIHSDFHAFWIDPADSNHILAGCDGGIWWTHDLGRNWDYVNNIPIGQFYEVAYDMKKPYNIYGGLQDNFSWGGPSATPNFDGPQNEDWVDIGGGDGFYNMVDWSNSDIVYQESQNGGVTRLNMATGERKSIRPRPPAGEPAYRFDWNTPMMVSPHDPKKLLMGGNRLFISRDRGDSWERTEDLSTQPDRKKMPIFGVTPPAKILSLDDGQDSFGQIVTLSESPRRAGVIYVGTDDGNLQVSQDDGKTWTNVAGNVPGVPRGTYVVRLTASRYADGRCYACFDGHRTGDFKPYIYVTEDYGQTWRPLAASFPEGSTLHVVREHPRAENLLFAGTERGAYVSFDRGATWTMLGDPLPPVPVDDIQIQPRENDLILGTHGRSIWILDDITPMERMAQRSAETDAAHAVLFEPRTAVEWRLSSKKGFQGSKPFIAPNPPAGALVQYYLKEKPTSGESVKVTILDKNGKTVIADLRAPGTEAGLNRVTWDLRWSPPATAVPQLPRRPEAARRDGETEATPTPQAAGEPRLPRQAAQNGRGGQSGRAAQTARNGQAAQGGRGGSEGGGGRFRGGFGIRGPRALPGTYVVRLTVGSEEFTQPLRVEEDPRLTISSGDRRAHFDTMMRLMQLNVAANETRSSLAGLRGQASDLLGSDAGKNATPEVKEQLDALTRRIAELERRLNPPARQRRFGDDDDTADAARADADDAGAPTAEMPHGQTDGLGSPKALDDDAEQEQAPAAPQAAKPAEPAEKPVTPVIERINTLTFLVDGITEAPSAYARQETREVGGELGDIVRELNEIQTRTLPSLNRELQAQKLKPLAPEPRVAMPR